jgi:hypothetical protein
MGVCPQFDVLWGELTGSEHLAIYGHIKGLPFSTVRGLGWVGSIAESRRAGGESQ